MTQWEELGFCDTEWVSDLAAAEASQLPEGVAVPQESWTCGSADTSVGITRWATDAEVTSFFAAIADLAKAGGGDLTQFSVLKLEPSIIVLAANSATGATDPQALKDLQAKAGGEVVTYATLAGQG